LLIFRFRTADFPNGGSMRKREFTTGRLTIAITIVMAVIFLLQYSSYSQGSNTQLQTNATSQLSYLHEYLCDDISSYYIASGSDSSVLRDNPPTIHLPIAGYAILDSSGTVLATTSPFSVGLPLSTQLQQYDFSEFYSSDAFFSAVDTYQSALTRFYCPPFSGDLYAYSGAIPETDITLTIFHFADLIDSQISVTNNRANSFILSVLIIMVVLATWLYFVHSYDRMILNGHKQLLATERRRYKVALASNKNFIWEYTYADDKMIWDDTNSSSDILLDFSGEHRKDAIRNNIVHPDDRTAFFAFCDAINSAEPVISAELRIRTPQTDYEWYRIHGTKILDDEGFPISIIGQTTNIHEQKLEYLALIEQAQQDPLTKLLTQTAFAEKTEQRIASMDEPVIMAMLLIDIDDFDLLNQTFGYIFADAVLLDLAGRLKKICPDNSLLSRYGGDEFTVLLDNVPSMAYVTEVVQQILHVFASFTSNTQADYTLSCGIGVSVYPVDATDYNTLFEKAETALYNAKLSGHGRYRIYDDTLPSIPEVERIRKNSKKNLTGTSLFETRSAIDSTIIANAIDILFDSQDIQVSINMILSLIGSYYNLDRIFIREYSEDGETSSITHEWFSDTRQSFALRGIIRSHKRTLLFRGYEQTDSDIYHCDNISESDDRSKILNDVFLADVQALVQCGIRFQKDYLGCICFCTLEDAHNWTSSELDSLALLSKLISGYLSHIHSQEKIAYVSQVDPLTNCYNLNTFLGRADEVLSENPNKNFATLYFDINQFKMINDNYGYRAGDYILISIASILGNTGQKESVVARITGDKFVALYSYTDINELTELAKNIVYQSKHIRRDNDEYYKLALLIGIYPIQPGDSAITAVDCANIARKNIVDYHLCNYMYYDESMHNTLANQKDIEDSMEDALRNHQFMVYYQPKFDIITKQLIGAEALVRWSRPTGMVSPAHFIPLFEENGFIVPLDYYVLDSVCAFLRARIDEGQKVVPISVNFSRLHLSTDVLPVVIKATLERYNIPPHMIEIEITESALAATEDYQLSILNELRALGCVLAMDDFGSGMSSLNALRSLPFDVLKIDRDFLQSESNSERERIVLSNVVRMAFALDMRVICEGVETVEQEAFLRQIGCNYVQGFLYARPLPEEQFSADYLDK